jgi:hypothetical protein
MKILILGTPRSGTTSLVKFIDSHIKLPNYKMIIEPFNSELDGYIMDIDSIINFKNLLIKNLFLIGNDEYPKDSFENVYEYFQWCFSYFDKIIILDRKDKIAQSESFVVNETAIRERGIGWHTPKIYDLTKIETSYIKTMINRYTESSKILNNISENKGYPIFYYEDIFLEHNIDVVKNILEYLEMELILDSYQKFILSPYRRVRIEKSNKKLL